MQKHGFRLLLASLMAGLLPAASLPAYSAVTPAAPVPAADRHQADLDFQKLKATFLKELWRQDPDLAMSAGHFAQADRLALPGQTERDAYVAFAERWLQRLQQVDATRLAPREQTDLVLMQNYLNGTRWYLTRFREFSWNPSQHNIAGGFDAILNTDYAPKIQRIRAAIRRLQQVPAYYAAARASISQPTPEHTRLAIRQSSGAVSVLAALESAAAEQKLSHAEQTALTTGLRQARTAIQEYVQFLENTEKSLDPATARSFRIGRALYEEKFKADIQSALTAEQMYQRALVAKQAAHDNMEKLADQLWDKTMGDTAKPADRVQKIAMVIDKLSEQHVAAKELYPEIRRQLPVLERWIREHDLLSLDAEKPLIVRETPEYERGVTVASIEAPGIFRPNDKTYYNVTPLDGQTPEQIESTLREYNRWVLQILNIHEAIPGHYTQLQYANQSPSVIKTLFGNGAMIEGWAVYSERMMLESGYGDQAPEIWLMYYKWNLRTICNTILDYSVHVLGMSEAEAKDLLMHQAFQTKTEADGKWLRVQYSSVQLTSYFSGYSEIMAFRDELKQQQGAQFKLKRFHEQFLSYGSTPVSMIRNMMLNDKSH